MHLRLVIITLSLLVSTSAYSQQGEADLSKELNAAESASGGTSFEPTPGPGEGSQAPTATKPLTKKSVSTPVPAPVDIKDIPFETDAPKEETKSLPPTTPLPAPEEATSLPPPPSEEPAPPEEVSSSKALDESLDSETPSGHTTVVPEDEDVTTGVNTNSQKICNCKFKSDTPYRERRPAITGLVGVQAGTYSPINYKPSFNGEDFSDYYGGGGTNVELIGGFKYNFILGSIGPQFGAGFYTTSNSQDGATLTIIPITIGAMFALDNIFPEPYVVPYVVGGVYTDIFKEAAGGLTFSGRTAISEYYAVGAMFQLDWLDSESHDSGYRDFGIQNTFIYVEARSFLASSDPGDPDLSTPLQISGGIKMEF